jgi:BirA family biotin operon repressor/biotin-[acetyl-CoA-carboxylase] ligase
VIGEPRLHEPECESTQQLLLDRAGELPDGAIATTDHQTAGRGRLGRSWDAPPGKALLFSILLKPPPERHAPELSLVAGVAVADTVERCTGLAVQLKWPNDVMLRRRKVAGLLAEARDGAVVLGIGLNVNQSRDELPADAGSLLTLTGREWRRDKLLDSLLADLGRTYAAWRSGGLDAVYEGLAPRDFLRGRRVSVNGTSGVATMIDRQGRLEIEVGHGDVVAVESGEVLYER